MKGLILICLIIAAFEVVLIVTEKELKIEVLEKPKDCEEKSQNGQKLSVLYKGSFESTGKVFDYRTERDDPFMFTIGVRKVIKGWDLGMLDMCVGEKRRLTIPPSLAYGEKGRPGRIPPHSTLIFEVELLAIDVILPGIDE